MKRIILILTIVLLYSFSIVDVKGETVSQKQAQEMARLFFNESAGKVMAPPKLIFNGRRLTTDRLFTPFYVYNNPAGGFVIISAENKAFPILGFSLKDNFDPDLMGDAENALLVSYAREIELIRYDSGYVEDAERAWINYPKYVKDILTSRYEATDPKFSLEEADQLLEYAVEDDALIFSDIYTPEQWREMILEELSSKESVPVWLVKGENVIPIVIHGHQGDYFRIELTRRNTWLMRLNATENISSNMVSTVLNPINLPNEEIEENAFLEFDTFTNEVSQTETSRRTLPHKDLSLSTEPRLLPLGGGHYEIILPERINLVRIFKLDGSQVNRYTFGNTMVANIDLSPSASGFYIVNAIDENGKSYGFKIYR